MSFLILKMTLGQIVRRPWSRLFTIVTFAVALTTIGLATALYHQFRLTLNEVDSVRMIVGYLNPAKGSVNDLDVISAVQKIKGVKKVEFIDQRKFLENFAKNFPDVSIPAAELQEDVIPKYVKVRTSTASEQAVAEQMVLVKGIQTIERNERRFNGLSGALRLLKSFSFLLIVTLCAVLALFSVWRFRVYSPFQRQFLRALDALGARGGSCMLPLLIEGLLEGFLGGCLASAFLLLIDDSISAQLSTLMRAMGFQFSPWHLSITWIVSVMGLGLTVGILGGFIGGKLGKGLSEVKT